MDMHEPLPREKKCFKCGAVKPLGEFYKHPRMADGHVNKCKECNRRDVRENRKSKLDYYRKYDAERFRNDPKRRADVFRATMERVANNPQKRAARSAVSNAVRDGRLVKPDSCSICGDTDSRIEGHHEDYSRPLRVVWVCTPCHAAIHSKAA